MYNNRINSSNGFYWPLDAVVWSMSFNANIIRANVFVSSFISIASSFGYNHHQG